MKTKITPLAFAAWTKNEDILNKSSSGGIFYHLAKYVIEHSGVVFSPTFNDDMSLSHKEIRSLDALMPALGSKYVQSSFGHCLKRIKELLEQSTLVLFSGTPCQCNALHLYLKRDYDNLFMVDLFCHGTPKTEYWLKYCKEEDIKDPKDISFRGKTYGWENFYAQLNRINEPHYQNDYMKLFLKNYILSAPCYNCKHKGENRYSDITLGDFWGVSKLYPQFYNFQGTSLVIVREKRDILIKILKENCELHPVDYLESTAQNIAYSQSAKRPKTYGVFSKLGKTGTLTTSQIVRSLDIRKQHKTFFSVFRFLGKTFRYIFTPETKNEAPKNRETKRIGIATMYFGSINFGGVLQAYALSTFLNNCGFECELLRYNFLYPGKDKKTTLSRLIHHPLGTLKKTEKMKYEGEYLNNSLQSFNCTGIRKTKFLEFGNAYINSSESIYTNNNLECIKGEYSTVITGSDQVFNENMTNNCFLLNFSYGQLTKIGYAISDGGCARERYRWRLFKKVLSDYSAISFREPFMVNKYLPYCKKSLKPLLTVDPTLLLAKEDYLKILVEPKEKEKYLLTYFLGNNNFSRMMAKEYALAHGLVLINVPMNFQKEINSNDNEPMSFYFGEKNLIKIGPAEFLGYIKNAEIVFTDSFHACVFSGMFEKQFFVFDRSANKEMNERILNICDLYNAKNRYIDNNADVGLLNNSFAIDYTLHRSKLDSLIKTSQAFLNEALAK